MLNSISREPSFAPRLGHSVYLAGLIHPTDAFFDISDVVIINYTRAEMRFTRVVIAKADGSTCSVKVGLDYIITESSLLEIEEMITHANPDVREMGRLRLIHPRKWRFVNMVQPFKAWLLCPSLGVYICVAVSLAYIVELFFPNGFWVSCLAIALGYPALWLMLTIKRLWSATD